MSKLSDALGEFMSKTTLKSFSVNALKNGGWKMALKFVSNADDTIMLTPFAVTYRPLKKSHTVSVLLLGHELKAQATMEGNRLIADLAIPEYLRVLLSMSGVSAKISPSVHLEITTNPIELEDGKFGIDISTEVNGKLLNLLFVLTSKDDEEEDENRAQFTKKKAIQLTGDYDDKPFSIDIAQVSTCEISTDTADILCDLIAATE